MKINDFFKKKFPFVSNYFETYFESGKRFPQSIVFEGLDILSEYFFTLELARVLNCENGGDSNCSCTNCRWIRENKHPSVISVTPLDFKEDGSKTVISVKQMEKVMKEITESSDYHRFFIFSDVKNQPLDSDKKEKIKEYEDISYFLSKEDWYPCPLNKKIMQEEASNSILKSVEEAPDKVTFVFLTNRREDIISTILSRSLVFKIPSKHEKRSLDVKEFFADYPNITIQNALMLSESFFEKGVKEELDLVDLFDSIEEYFLEIIKNNSQNKKLISFLNSDIKKASLAKKRIKALVMPKYAVESFFVSLSNEGRKL